MKLTHTLIFMALMSVAAVSCSEKKQPSNIIAHKPVKKAPSAPVKMQNSDYEDAVSWIGSSYNVKISRRSDTGLPLIVDDSGNKYYDNVITLSVVRPDGSEFFNRKFTKSDFSSYIGEEYAKKSALLGIVLEKADGDNLKFAASVGAPDVLSDDYVPLIITISRTGGVSIEKDSRIDSNSDQPDDEDEGV